MTNTRICESLKSMGLILEEFDEGSCNVIVVLYCLGQMVDAGWLSNGSELSDKGKRMAKLLVESGYIVPEDDIDSILEALYRNGNFDDPTRELFGSLGRTIHGINVHGIEVIEYMANDMIIDTTPEERERLVAEFEEYTRRIENKNKQ